MKVALINGQNHKGSTYHIGRMLAEKLTDEGSIAEVFVPRDMPNFCLGCAKCIMVNEKSCPHFNLVAPITEKIDSADVLIFTSPVYVFHASGSMKALLDHYAYRWMPHRPEEKMFGKQGVCIATAAGAGMKSTIKDMRDSLSFWGVGRIYSYGVGVAAISWDKVSDKKKVVINEKIDSLAQTIKRHEGKVHPSLKSRVIFSVMRMTQKKGWNPVDASYWKEKGWMDKKRPWKA